MTNSFAPAGTVTGIGALPVSEPSHAVSFIAEHSPELPFTPRLCGSRNSVQHLAMEALGGLVDLLQTRGPDRPGFHVPEGRMGECLAWLNNPSTPPNNSCNTGLAAFEQALDQRSFPHARAIKGHIIGPMSLAMGLFRGQGRGRSFANHAWLRQSISGYVANVARWRVQRLRRFNLPVLMFVHEPALALSDQASDGVFFEAVTQMLDSTLTAIAREGGRSALHGGGTSSWRVLPQARPDILTMPIDEHLSGCLREHAIKRFLEDGGGFAFATNPNLLSQPKGEQEQFNCWLGSVAQSHDIQQMARHSFITVDQHEHVDDVNSLVEQFSAANRLAALLRRIAIN